MVRVTSPAPSLALPWDEPVPVVASAATALAANTAYFVRARRESLPRLITNIEVYTGTSSGNLDVALFSLSGTTLTLLSSSGSTASSATNGWQAIPLLAPQWKLPGGDYFYAVSPDNATVTLGRVAGTANANLRGFMAALKSAQFPFASNASPSLDTSTLTSTASAVVVRGT